MTFEVINKSNSLVMATDYVECIPDEMTLKHMSNAGYKFKLNGKRCNVSDVSKLSSERFKRVYILCKDTKERFRNQAEAARHFNIDPAQVSDSIKTGRPRSGYTFEKVTD